MTITMAMAMAKKKGKVWIFSLLSLIPLYSLHLLHGRVDFSFFHRPPTTDYRLPVTGYRLPVTKRGFRVV